MMNILVLNGSPKGKNSNTYMLANAFLSGMKTGLGDSAAVETADIYDLHIEPCKGCFGCWTKTPGKCVIHDDMDALLPKIIQADFIIWSFPLYYYGMPSKMKALLDRNLPLNLPFMEKRLDGGYNHPDRYGDRTTKHILISTAGLPSRENNYEALSRQFDIIFGDSCTQILCPEGELFSRKELRSRTEEYLSYVEEAGEEYVQGNGILAETAEKLEEFLYPPESYMTMADASWDIQEDTADGKPVCKKQNTAERFTRQMAATYHCKSFDGIERVFEIYYTDVKEKYQLVMGKERCEVRTEDFDAFYTTRVETPLSVWQSIAEGECNGARAMMEGKYRTFGDLKLLMSWERYFSLNNGSAARTKKKKAEKKTNLFLCILPWCVIWVLLMIHPVIGGAVGILTAACIHFANLKWKLTVYDDISCLCVSAFGLLALLHFNIRIIVPLSYLAFGLMWLGSCFTHIPLSAHYSKENYNGDEALENPLFMKTNLILTVCWGVLYLVTPVWTYYIMGSSIPYLCAFINLFCPAALGVFTNWFEKWYPSKIAGR